MWGRGQYGLLASWLNVVVITPRSHGPGLGFFSKRTQKKGPGGSSGLARREWNKRQYKTP